jgi:hypothetical protein
MVWSVDAMKSAMDTIAKIRPRRPPGTASFPGGPAMAVAPACWLAFLVSPGVLT